MGQPAACSCFLTQAEGFLVQIGAGFSFASAAATNSSLFGTSSFSFGASQPQSAPAFGNPFGAPTSTPQFGASSAASTPSEKYIASSSSKEKPYSPGCTTECPADLFGASSSSFSFGSAGLFGNQSQAASASSVFGSNQSFGGFGASQPQSQFALSTTLSSSQSQLAPAGFSTGLLPFIRKSSCS